MNREIAWMVAVLFALVAVLACGPAAPSNTTGGVDGAVPQPRQTADVALQQVSDQVTPDPTVEVTPLPTVCPPAQGHQTQAPEDCYVPTPPGPESNNKLSSNLDNKIRDALIEAASAAGPTPSPADSERIRVIVELLDTSHGDAVIQWLRNHQFPYNDARDTYEIYAIVPILLLPELSDLPQVVWVRPVPAPYVPWDQSGN